MIGQALIQPAGPLSAEPKPTLSTQSAILDVRDSHGVPEAGIHPSGVPDADDGRSAGGSLSLETYFRCAKGLARIDGLRCATAAG